MFLNGKMFQTKLCWCMVQVFWDLWWKDSSVEKRMCIAFVLRFTIVPSILRTTIRTTINGFSIYVCIRISGFAHFCKSFVLSHVIQNQNTTFFFQFYSNVWRQCLPRVNFLQGYSSVWFIYSPEDSGNCIHLHTWHRQTKTAKNKNQTNSGIIRTFLE